MITYSEGMISLEDYKRLRRDAEWFELEDAQVRQSLDNSDYIVSAVEDGEVIGVARCISDKSYVTYVYDVIVLSARRGEGIGRSLVERIVSHYEKSGCVMQIVLLAIKKDTEEFYKKIGFKKYPNILNGSGMGRWINGKPY